MADTRPLTTPAGSLFSVMIALGRSKGSLEMIGDGDWTPQDAIHQQLVNAVEASFTRPCPRIERRAGCECRHCSGVCLCEPTTAQRIDCDRHGEHDG